MEVKVLEVRDKMTFMPVLAIWFNTTDSREHWLLHRAGFHTPTDYLMVAPLTDLHRATTDPFDHSNARTMRTLHQHLYDHWSTIKTGDLIDIEVVLGEKTTPKVSEQVAEDIRRMDAEGNWP